MLEPSSPVFAGNFDQDWGVNTFGDERLASAMQPARGHGGKKRNNLEFEPILQDFVLLTFLVSLGFWRGLCMAKRYNFPFSREVAFLTLLQVREGTAGWCCWLHQGEQGSGRACVLI